MDTVDFKQEDKKEPTGLSELESKISKLENNPVLKIKQMKLPRKGKVSKRKIRKGWVGILKVFPNKAGEFEKQKVVDNVIQLKEGTYHAIDGSEVIMIKGKFPLVIQRVDKINPIKVHDDTPNETYGQKYIMAKMLKDVIVQKSKGGSIIIWILIIGALIFGGKFVMDYFSRGG